MAESSHLLVASVPSPQHIFLHNPIQQSLPLLAGDARFGRCMFNLAKRTYFLPETWPWQRGKVWLSCVTNRCGSIHLAKGSLCCLIRKFNDLIKHPFTVLISEIAQLDYCKWVWASVLMKPPEPGGWTLGWWDLYTFRSATHTIAKEWCTTFWSFLASNLWNADLICLEIFKIIGSCWLRPHANTAW